MGKCHVSIGCTNGGCFSDWKLKKIKSIFSFVRIFGYKIRNGWHTRWNRSSSCWSYCRKSRNSYSCRNFYNSMYYVWIFLSKECRRILGLILGIFDSHAKTIVTVMTVLYFLKKISIFCEHVKNQWKVVSDFRKIKLHFCPLPPSPCSLVVEKLSITFFLLVRYCRKIFWWDKSIHFVCFQKKMTLSVSHDFSPFLSKL